jgi:hypothetical protein
MHASQYYYDFPSRPKHLQTHTAAAAASDHLLFMHIRLARSQRQTPSVYSPKSR